MQNIQNLLEKQLFGVCTWIAERMGVRVRRVRLSFIYLSFLTFGSPVLFYLVVHFWRQNNHIFKPWTWGREVGE